VTTRPHARAYAVRRRGTSVVETALPVKALLSFV
jgi:hypothetical protein